MKGKIISFEGLDGSFKETNAKRLYEYLSSNLRGTKCNLVSFPRYDDDASVFVKKLLNETYKDLNSRQIKYFYALDRFDYINTNNVKERLENGEWFIFDRYVESNVIYQASCSYDKNIISMFADDIYKLEYGILDLPKPDIIIALRSEFELIKTILKEKDNKDDKYENDLEFLERVFKCYNIMIDMYKWNRIDTCKKEDDKFVFRTKEDIFNDILKLLRDKNIIK